jgi:hypothetical protein
MHHLAISALALSRFQHQHQVGPAEEARLVTLLCGEVTERDRKMRLSTPMVRGRRRSRHRPRRSMPPAIGPPKAFTCKTGNIRQYSWPLWSSRHRMASAYPGWEPTACFRCITLEVEVFGLRNVPIIKLQANPDGKLTYVSEPTEGRIFKYRQSSRLRSLQSGRKHGSVAAFRRPPPQAIRLLLSVTAWL